MPLTRSTLSETPIFRSRIVQLAFTIVLLCGHHQVLAQSRVTGEVRSAEGAPIAGAIVRVESPDLRAPATATTDAAGRYAIENIKPGIWAQITALHQNGRVLARAFTLVTQNVETVNLQGQPESSSARGVEDLDPMGGPTAAIRGIVRAPDGSVVAGARVSIADTPIVTTTDSAGRYAFDGLRTDIGVELVASADGYTDAHAKVVVPSNGPVEATLALEPPRVSEGEPASRATFDTTGDERWIRLRGSDLARIPALERGDLFRALQFLPAASAANEASSELFVRGGTPDHTGITFDGFTIYPIRHVFGVFSTVNMDAVDQAEFAATNVDAEQGGHLAGALRLTGASGPKERPGGAVDLSILGLGMRFTVPLGTRGSLLLAGRRSPPSGLYNDVLDYFYGMDTDAARERTAGFSGGPFPAQVTTPSFYDLNGKLQLDVSSRDRISVTLYNARDVANGSHDVLLPGSDAIGEPNPLALPRDATMQVTSLATWRGRGAAAAWMRRWSPSATTAVTVGRSEFSNDADAASVITSPSDAVDYSFMAGRGGSQATSEENAIRDTTIRLTNSIAFGYEHAFSAGVEVVSLDSSYRASTEIFQHVPGTGQFDSTLVDLLNRDTEATAMSAFVQDAWRPLSRLTVTPGLRATRYDLAAETYFDPRVSATYLLRPQVRLTAGASIDHQLANRIVREDLARGDTAFWTLADGTALAVPRARLGFVGAAVELPGFLWSTQAYYKRLDGLTTFAPRLFPGIAADPASVMLHEGSGRSMGIETIVRHETDRNTLWTSLTLGRTEYTYPTLQSETFPAPFDRKAELRIADTVRFGRAWSIGGVWVAASGRPVTPASGVEPVWFPSGETVYRIVFGNKNSTHLPAYHRLDLTAQRDFSMGGLKTVLGTTVFNVFDRRNVAYTEHEVADQALTSTDVLLMRRSVNVFVRFAF